ncbi:MAG: hypothetical protein ACJ74Q_12160 [Pyrinomonadaceae bacterium]
MRKTNTTLTLTCAWALTILFASAARGETRAATAPSRCNDGRTLFVANYNTNELEVIDLARLPLTQK